MEKLGSSLRAALQKLSKSTHVDEKTVKELVRDIQRALLQADVEVRLVLDLTKRIEKRALEEKVPPGLNRRAHVTKIVFEELSDLLGKPAKFEVEPGKTKVVMMVGLQGSGKTTTVAKLAAYFKRRGYRVGVVCADTYRPGALEQLRQLSEKGGFDVFGDTDGREAVEIAKAGVEHFRRAGYELILIDTAGRHRRESDLMDEMKRMAEEVRPDEVMLVIDGTIGQQARAQAEAFNSATPIGSIFVAKLDGTAKGGGALSAVAATGAAIKFIGTGEHIDEIEPYDPAKFLARLLGMGDLETLLKRIEEIVEREKIKVPERKDLATGRLTLRDVYQQLEALEKAGPLKKILQMLPGVGASIPEEQFRVGEEKLKKFKVIMQSMTKEELENPKIINASRIRRIARGSGTSEADVRELLKQYEVMQKVLKTMAKGRLPKAGPWAKLLRSIQE